MSETRTLALRISVSTLRGARECVPAMAAVLAKHHAGATFFFNFGPDAMGRALLRGHTYGFLSRKHAFRTYGASIFFPGLLTPAPTVADDAADVIRTTRDAGFEVGVQGWDALAWAQDSADATNTWIEDQLAYARDAYERVLGNAPTIFSAYEWTAHRHLMRRGQQMGFTFSSVSRGTQPYVPIIKGEPVALTEIPTTLLTTRELLASGRANERTLTESVLNLTASVTQPQVMALTAEADGHSNAAQLDTLLAGWRAQGWLICDLSTYAAKCSGDALPRCTLEITSSKEKSASPSQQGKPYFLSPNTP
jgi:undecaprenyl phosphate-alpha-L-ara4FN deformylase